MEELLENKISRVFFGCVMSKSMILEPLAESLRRTVSLMKITNFSNTKRKIELKGLDKYYDLISQTGVCD